MLMVASQILGSKSAAHSDTDTSCAPTAACAPTASELQGVSPRVTKAKHQRQCVGCGKREDATSLVRVVLGPQGEVAVDLANRSIGRGAHVHANAACLKAAASGGLAKSFRCRVTCTAQELSEMLLAAGQRRMDGLLRAAALSRVVVVGRQPVEAALAARWQPGPKAATSVVDLVIVARDAGDVARGKVFDQAIAQGLVVAWGTKRTLGGYLGQGMGHESGFDEVAVAGVCNPKLAHAMGALCRMMDTVENGRVGKGWEVR